jgi:uncharacterized protein (DUF1501 family)
MTGASVLRPSRRTLLRYALAGGGTLMLPAGAARAAGAPDDPHFFLLILLNGGADSSYMFDARPLSMTKAGRIQNYLGADPLPWEGRNGVSCRASPLVQPLAAYRDRFSVLNGVYMAPGFDGHLQNANFLFAGNAFGGDSFIPYLNGLDTGHAPMSLDAVSPTDLPPVNVDNHSAVVSLQPQAAGGLAAKLRRLEPVDAGSALGRFIGQRLRANAGGMGRFAAGTRHMLDGLARAPALHHKLSQLTAPDPHRGPEAQAVGLISECFRLAVARSAIYVLPEFFDVHAADLAKAQPRLFRSAIARLAALLRGLVETPFDRTRAMIDVTTVLVASEFGRTMRAADAPVDRTGTNHNGFANSFLFGGKGVRPGLVIGATDLADEKAKPAPAHLAMDPPLEKTMGLPFDFKALRPGPAPDEFELEDHLSVSSIVNSVYAMFGVPKERHRAPGRNLPPAPVLAGLLC